jgi:hypothetical protein
MIQSQIDALAEELPRVVAESRAAGASWAAIAERLGTSPQNAHKRFRKRVAPVADLPLSDPLFDPLFMHPKN